MSAPIRHRAAATYLCLFLAAVAAAPHNHVNGLEDLILDERSDSGTVLEVFGQAGLLGAPAWNPSLLVRDVPCLACFTRDFVAAATESILSVPRLTLLAPRPEGPGAATPDRIPAETSSRAPPSR